jgi:TPP-dependent pyruvate/acetoin dehydrogenase alpha subunit
MGKSTGLVGGRGGSQHIQWRNFYSNGIQGGIVPVAVGMALAEKVRRTGQIVLAFIGDGTLGEGVLYESINMAALWKLPILFVLEDNHYAQTTPVEKGVAGSMAGRFSVYGMPVWERDTTDVLEVSIAAKEAVQNVRSALAPGCLILHTYRFSAHSKGDDPRLPEEIARIRLFDPLPIQGQRLSPGDREMTEHEIMATVEDAFRRAEADPYPVLDLEGQPSNVTLLTFKP